MVFSKHGHGYWQEYPWVSGALFLGHGRMSGLLLWCFPLLGKRSGLSGCHYTYQRDYPKSGSSSGVMLVGMQ